MKRIILSALLIGVLTSCKKLNDVLPESPIQDNDTETTQPASPEDTKLLVSLKVTPVVEDTQEQEVKVSTKGSMLNLSYNERVQMLIDKERYDKSWYIVFNEDFKNTQLEDMDYEMVMQWGDTVLNWKPYNLHQIDKQVSDTVIAGVKVVNVKFKRTFNFFKDYGTAEEAATKMNNIVGKKEKLKFLTRYEPDADTTRYYVNTVNLVYTK